MNGKALMHGVSLRDLPASDALDVIHYIFEEDMLIDAGELGKARSKLRTNLYRELYGVTYAYPVRDSRSASSFGGPDLPDLDPPLGETGAPKPFNPRRGPTKAYIPPTTIDPDSSHPLGAGLDAPLN